MSEKSHDHKPHVRIENDCTFDRPIEPSIDSETHLAERPQISCTIAADLEFMRAVLRSDVSSRDMILEAWEAERLRAAVVVGHA